jgi:hypothetical protein
MNSILYWPGPDPKPAIQRLWITAKSEITIWASSEQSWQRKILLVLVAIFLIYTISTSIYRRMNELCLWHLLMKI